MSLTRKLRDAQALGYLIRSAANWARPSLRACPCCGKREYESVSSKALVTKLVRCPYCALLYRIPGEAQDSSEFYQEAYESGGLTTSLPHRADLDRYLENSFRGTDKNFSAKIEVLKVLGVPQGARVLDFGASWGYATWQLRESGYQAIGFEVSRPRAEFGNRALNVEIYSNASEIEGPLDAVFTSHVFEHLPCPKSGIELVQKWLRPGGVFVCFTPNGALERMKENRRAYDHSWGRLHPVYLDPPFFKTNLPAGRHFFTSRRYGRWQDLNDVAAWASDTTGQGSMGDVLHPELLTIWENAAS